MYEQLPVLCAGEYTVVMLRTLRSPEVETANWLDPFVADFRCVPASTLLAR